MKLKTILKVSAISLTALLASCGDKKDDHAGHDHGDHEGHDHGDHAGHDHGKEGDHEDHSQCGVVVGPNGGRMIQEVAELNLTDANALTLTFVAAPAEGTKVLALLEGTPLALTQADNVFTSAPIAELPGEVIIKITEATGNKITEPPFQLEAGKCTECSQAKLACTCHNHDHDDHEGHHDHDH